jgi:hypothetical protein
MPELKTKPTDQDVVGFINAVTDERVRTDCFTLLELMGRITGSQARMWGASMVGFGVYTYKYATGHKGEAFISGFSPRKQNLTLYIMAGFERYDTLMSKLGKHTTGKSCLYVKRLSDIELPVLTDLITQSVAHMRANYPTA